MKQINKLLTAILLVLTVFCTWVSAKNNVSEIDIDVTVRDDGSAYIVQNWQGTFNEGTENYIPINTGDISISEFKVSDRNGPYTLLENWDIDAGFDMKAFKCGIVETSGGVELCFGISVYGQNRYAIEYVVEDFIKSYTDFDGTNFMFVNPGMSTFPTDAHINIVLQNGTQLTENNAGIWAFGYDGYVEFKNGSVNAYTSSALRGENSMIVMLRLDKGLVFPKTHVDRSFDTVKDKAFEGGDYGEDYYEEEPTLFETIIGFVVFFGFCAGIILFITSFIKRKRAIKKFKKECGYFRDVPNGGKIDISHYLAQTFDVSGNESLIIGALILSMINRGCIQPEKEETTGFFGKVKESVNLKLVKEPDTPSELTLYNLLCESAGEDGILQKKELEKYSYKNPVKINDFIKSIKTAGEMAFISLGGFADGTGNRIKDLSDKGKQELSEVIGLKKYLDEFTLIAEREISETIIWKEYMVYATLFGIADKVIKQFKEVYPEKIPEIETYDRNVVIAYSYYHSMHRSAQRAIQAKRTSGGGGRASFGGGGGFSGGGRGGGSR
ncbi:MAG: DUF2207 domain-containing protein [Clostridia bacterium]|nr:DUF2207 domain-containing protein [Clostridia bacterium]